MTPNLVVPIDWSHVLNIGVPIDWVYKQGHQRTPEEKESDTIASDD